VVLGRMLRPLMYVMINELKLRLCVIVALYEAV
jgi:hypothetical protein